MMSPDPVRRRDARIRTLIAGVATLALAGMATYAQPPARATFGVEWIVSDEGHDVSTVPTHIWRDDGTALLYDEREPAATRTFVALDPRTGARQPALDMARAIESLRRLEPRIEIEEALDWPAAFDVSGRHAVYLLKEDVFLLDLRTATFTRVTSTPEEEKSPGFSPDGQRLAYVRANDLYVFEIASGAETRVTRDGSETTLNGTLSWVYWEEIFGRADIGYWWAPDSRGIAYLQTDESPVGVATFVDFAPAPPRTIRQRYPTAGTPNPRVRVGIAEIGRNGTQWIQIADHPFEYVMRVEWLPDGRRVAVETLSRDQRTLHLDFAARADGVTTHVLTETDPAWVNVHDDLHFLGDGRHFLWASERDGYAHLYRYTLDGTLVNQVTKGAWAIASSGGGVYWVRRAVVGIDARAGWIYVTALERSSIERHLYRVMPDGTRWSRVSDEAGVHHIVMAPDTRAYLDTFSNARTPPSLTLHVLDGGSSHHVTLVSAPRTDALAGFGLEAPELLTIPAADGFRMPARLLRPKTPRGSVRVPVIMRVYGGPSAPEVANGWQEDLLFDYLLAAEGFAVLRVDNRSAAGISKTLENTILLKSPEPESLDLLDAVRWLTQQTWVDPARIGVWGWSGGGTMTLDLMTRSTAFKAGIAVAPVTDWRYYDTKWVEAFMKTPTENPEGYARTSLVARAAKLHGRLLIVHGTYDDNVHPQNSQAFIDALVRADILFDAMIYPMRKHGLADRAAQVHVYRTMLEFWKKNL